MISLINQENKLYHKQKVCYICKKKFSIDCDDKKYYKSEMIVTEKYRDAAHNICNLRYKTLKEIPVVFYNGSKYDNHFIIKKIAEKVKGHFQCLGENTEKYITFSIPTKENFIMGIQLHTK